LYYACYLRWLWFTIYCGDWNVDAPGAMHFIIEEDRILREGRTREMGILEKLATLLNSKDERVSHARPGRNEPCWCGSGKKYKKCHEPADDKAAAKPGVGNCGPT